MKKEKEYKYSLNFPTDKLKKAGAIGLITLEDKTEIGLFKGEICIRFPKVKFQRIFNKQLKDKTKKHISISFNEDELDAILICVKILISKGKKK